MLRPRCFQRFPDLVFAGGGDGRWGGEGEGRVEEGADAAQAETVGQGFGEEGGAEEVLEWGERVRGGESVGLARFLCAREG